SLQSKETRTLEVPVIYSIPQLKYHLCYSLFHPPTFPSSLRLSLNEKDELSSPSPHDSLLSLGITSGDLIYYDFSSSSAQQPGNSPSQIEDIGGECIDLEIGKRLSEPNLLRRVLSENMGNDFSDNKLVFLAIHAVLIESGFVGFNSMSGLKKKEKASMNFTTSVSYTLPQLLSDDINDTKESIVLKFQNLGHYVNVYGSLANSQLGLHKLNIDKSRFVPAIGTFWVTGDGCDRVNEMDSNAEKVIFELWKFVKDGLALPLLIDLCEKTGLDLPPCLIGLPADLKFSILELLPGQDIARVACVCKEMKYLSSNNELWKEKHMSEFGTGAVSSHTCNWKARFASSLKWKRFEQKQRIRVRKAKGSIGYITRHPYVIDLID
ncbi:F-box protein SKIP22-like, partial [Euphorbia lathyris]|uniref:F-box protein SKIP22-like n=1 Tax=Euphorbia lathyris TaxID=212925 RepID=UPI0033136C12